MSLTARTTHTARIEADGAVKRLDGKAEPDEVVTDEDAKEPAKVARLFVRLLKEVATLKRRFAGKRVDFEGIATGQAGAVKQLAHHFAGAVRWSVAGWSTTATPTTDIQFGSRLLWCSRALWGALTVAWFAGTDLTVGCRFQVSSACSVMGARFLWPAQTKTVKATLWRDSDGAVLGSGTAACVNAGVYTVTFAAPVTLAGADLNVNLTLGIHDGAGSGFVATGLDAAFSGYLPMALPGLALVSLKTYSAGDARPASDSATALFWVEPVLTPAQPQLVESTATDGDTLVLTSYVPGLATIRAEAAG